MTGFIGILHVHSTHSHDGRHPLSEIAEFSLRRGYRFVCMTEHAESLTPMSFHTYIDECRQVSSPQCLIIPGLEIDCKHGLHIMGFGLTSWVKNGTPSQVAASIRDSGGIAVIAHPKKFGYQVTPDLADAVHGIEVWNQGYDGRFLPNHRSLGLLQRVRRQNPSLLAFAGLDLHRITSVSHLCTLTSVLGETQESILQALRNGKFTVASSCLRLGSAGNRLNFNWIPLTMARSAYEVARTARDRLRSLWQGEPV